MVVSRIEGGPTLRNALALAALTISLIALALAVRAGRARTPRIDPARALAAERQAERIATLEHELQALREAAHTRALQPPALPAEERMQRLEELTRRIVREEVAARAAAAGPRAHAEREEERPSRRAEPAERTLEPGAAPASSPASLERLIRQAQNPARSEEERLQALDLLRGERVDGQDARLPVVGAMVEVGLHSKDPAIRAEVWRQLHGLTDPLLRAPLLYALQNDPDARPREEAAESLDGFLPDAQVEEALRTAAEHDVDDGVRRQAAESLASQR